MFAIREFVAVMFLYNSALATKIGQKRSSKTQVFITKFTKLLRATLRIFYNVNNVMQRLPTLTFQWFSCIR